MGGGGRRGGNIVDETKDGVFQEVANSRLRLLESFN